MTPAPMSLRAVFDGWDGYQTSLVHAIAPLTPQNLAWRPGQDCRSLGEVAAHISFGRIEWFHRMGAPGSADLAAEAAAAQTSSKSAESAISLNPAELVRWLKASWIIVERTLDEWTVGDLRKTYPHAYQGHTYAVSRQWTVWRIMAHDIHHGGQITTMLSAQGIAPRELSDLGGHIAIPAVID